MSGGFDAIADIGLGDILGGATDVGSLVTDLGTEFMDVSSFTSFEVPGVDVASLGGFGEVGSFAGSSSWFDTFNPGSILSSIPSVSDFSLPSLPGLPSLGSLNVNSLVTSASSSFGIPTSVTSAITKTLSNPSLISAGAAALGINPSIALTASRVLAGGSPVAAGAAALGINPSIATSLTAKATNLFTTDPNASNARNAVTGQPINTPREVDAYGLSILTDAEATALIKNAPLINTLTDPATAQPLTYDNALASRAELNPAIKSYTDAIAEAQQNIQSNNANIAAIEKELADEALPDDRRLLLEEYLQANYENNAIQQNTIDTNTTNLNAAATNLAADQTVITSTNTNVTQSPAPVNPQSVSQGVNIGGVSLGDLALATDPGATTGASARNLVQEARNQAAARSVANTQAQASDWRVRLRLAPNSTYLYNSGDPGILSALKKTDGVIFPYTPSIETAYKANYDPYDLTHSNYRGYFYKNSYVDALNVRATFTAQDTNEANYLLAVIHFFRSATKMFYGQDQQRGSPPPLVYISGYGDFQFNEHPCVISQFNYTLPPDVDYIRAQSALNANTNMLGNRIRNPIANNPLAYAANRLLNSGLLPGALDFRPNIATNLPTGNPSYVPTKMEISISLLPIQSRQQVSKNFSVKEFAQGNLLKGGYW